MAIENIFVPSFTTMITTPDTIDPNATIWDTRWAAELQVLDECHIKTQYISIDLLDLYDNPITDGINHLEGYATNGSVILNGKSSLRRTASLTLVVDENMTNITDIKNTIAINKRVKLSVGIQNGELANQPIYWFNLGIYHVTQANCSYSAQGISISMNLQDKMCLLNGTHGGKFSSGVIHSPILEEDAEGNRVDKYPLCRELIEYVITGYSEIPKDQIMITDIPDYISNTVRWVGNNPVYGATIATIDLENNKQLKIYVLQNTMTGLPTDETSKFAGDTFQFNDNIGYQITDYTWPQDSTLESNAGETVASVLDKIKNFLGNYEYFFDTNGQFIFQEQKNGIHQGSKAINLEEALIHYYLPDDDEKEDLISYYTFNNSPLVTSYSHNPQYANIKNDIIVWGMRGDSKAALRYHLLIDTAFEQEEFTESFVFTTDDFGIKRAYYRDPKDQETLTSVTINATTDWRQYYYLRYRATKETEQVFDPYHIGEELLEEWPKIYNISAGHFFATGTETTTLLNSMTYFIDRIEPEIGMPLMGITITNIGQRQEVKTDKDVNTVFSPQFPNIAYIEVGAENINKIRAEAIEKADNFSQVSSDIYARMAIGTAKNAAFDAVRLMLSDIIGYAENISITTLPLYWLEPNICVDVKNDEAKINGRYMIHSITLPLTSTATSTIAASKVIAKI